MLSKHLQQKSLSIRVRTFVLPTDDDIVDIVLLQEQERDDQAQKMSHRFMQQVKVGQSWVPQPKTVTNERSPLC